MAFGRIVCAPKPAWEMAMGKYVLAWLLGVPAIVLVVIYLFFH